MRMACSPLRLAERVLALVPLQPAHGVFSCQFLSLSGLQHVLDEIVTMAPNLAL